ncbi:MAG: hypothetical protein J0L92_29725 [Deltaproteobacteria bacterium]|nr:hypothetical protein [Deltaproteobacteria bacterium]
MSVDQHQRLVIGSTGLAVITWLISIALPVATSAAGSTSHGIVYLCFGWMYGVVPRENVFGWCGHIPAAGALVLLGLGSMRPWRIASRLALWLAVVLASLGLALAFDSVWHFQGVAVLGGDGGPGWTLAPSAGRSGSTCG